jgi:hypothetical protein
MVAYAKNLLRNSSLQGYLRAMHLCGPISSSDEDPKSLTQIFSQSPQLTRLCALKTYGDDNNYEWARSSTLASLLITWENFVALANTAGPVLETLEDVYIHAGTQEFQNPSIFGQLSALRYFECYIYAHFISSTDSISPHYLSSLVSLRLTGCDPSFLAALSCMKCVTRVI